MYIGEKEISDTNGNIVTFTDGTTQELSDKQLSYLITEEKQDATELRELVIKNVLPDLEEVMSEEDELILGKAMFDIIELHDITNIEVASTLARLQSKLISDHNAFLKEKVGEEMDKFQSDIKKVQAASKIVDDSFTKALFIATGISLGTYEKGQPEENFLENIRPSHLSKVIKSIQ